ncbi:MAG: lyase [Gemmatimonadota bacterium]
MERLRWCSSLGVIALSLGLTGDANAARQLPLEAVPVHEWPVPWKKSRPRDPAVAPDGRIWFVGQVGNYVARLEPKTSKFDRFEIPVGTNPHNIIVDGGGNAWFSGNQNGTIGRLDAKTGKLTTIPLPDPAAKDPHTLVLDRAGDIWFTVQGGNFVGKLTVPTQKIQLIKIPIEGARPYGIVIDANNRPWFDLFGTNKIGTVDPKTMELREYPLPDPQSRPRRIALTSDGAIWYGDYTRGQLGRLDPKTGTVKEWATPGGKGALVYAMTSDDRDRLWLVETGKQPNRLVAFDSKTERWVSATDIPSGGGTVRYMVYDPATKTIWFGTDNDTIGKAEIGKLGRGTT